MKRLMMAIGLVWLPALADAHDFLAGDVAVGHPYISPTITSAMSGAGYFVLTNTGSEDDRLLDVEADFPRVMMHNSVVQDGVATMLPLDEGVIIPAGESIQFAPSGMHVMFMGLGGDPFEVGEEIRATLTFERGGKVDIVFFVEDFEHSH